MWWNNVQKSEKVKKNKQIKWKQIIFRVKLCCMYIYFEESPIVKKEETINCFLLFSAAKKEEKKEESESDEDMGFGENLFCPAGSKFIY